MIKAVQQVAKVAVTAMAAMALGVGVVSLASPDDQVSDAGGQSASTSTAPSASDPTPSDTATTTAAAPSEAASTPPSPATPWDELLADGDVDDLVEPDEVRGLPAAYWPEPGSDQYTDEVFDRVLRRDVAAYLLRVRHESPKVADRLSFYLPLVPVGWCSVVAPRWTWAEFQRNARQDLDSAVLLADLLDVRYEPLLSAPEKHVMRFAVAEAARRFCSENSLGLAAPVKDAAVSEAARFPAKNASSVQRLQREGHALHLRGHFRADTYSKYEFELAFQSALVGVSDVPTAFGCDMAAYFAKGDNGVRQTAKNILELNPSRDDRLFDVWEHQRLAYLVEEEHRACRDGRL